MSARVLIIDDNVTLAENLRDVLLGVAHLDLEIELASAGAAGLAMARRRPFDVAVVDVKLPDVSGLDLVKSLAACSPDGEVVLVTGFATIDNAVQALRTGVFAFILKSFRPEELIATVEQALSKVALKRDRTEYERRYRTLVEAADACIVGLDDQAKVLLFNARLAAITGTPKPEALGKSFGDRWVVPSDRARLATAFAAAWAGETVEVETGIKGGDGRTRQVRWHLSKVRESREQADLVSGIGVDVTDRRELERRVAAAEALNAMAPLALGLAHEIRNPLNAAVLQLHLLGKAIHKLEDVDIQAPMTHRVHIVEGEIRRLERMLTEFLELARPRAPQREAVDLDRVVGDVLELEAEAIEQAGVSVERHLEAQATVSGDVEKLKQVVLNLVVNALDAMPDGGTLLANVTKDSSRVVFELVDSGGGVDPKDLAEIFDPFFTTKPAGTGLGLAIVRKILNQHGGDIELLPTPTRGARVIVVLPRADVQR